MKTLGSLPRQDQRLHANMKRVFDLCREDREVWRANDSVSEARVPRFTCLAREASPYRPQQMCIHELIILKEI